MNKYLRLLLFSIVLAGVSCGKQIPGDIIQPSEMEDLLYDYHLALTMGNDLNYNDRYKQRETGTKQYTLRHYKQCLFGLAI